ncbi:MAG: helicase-associated domain-containing protein [Thermoflexales bacterium]
MSQGPRNGWRWATAYDYHALRTPLEELLAHAKQVGWLPSHSVAASGQIAQQLLRRGQRIQQSPESLLEGLSPEARAFATHLLTARDPLLPISAVSLTQGWKRLQLIQPSALGAQQVLEELAEAYLLLPSPATCAELFAPPPRFEWSITHFGYSVQRFDQHSVDHPPTGAETQPPVDFPAEFSTFLEALLSAPVELRLRSIELIAQEAQRGSAASIREVPHGWEFASTDVQTINQQGWDRFRSRQESAIVVPSGMLADTVADQLAATLHQQPLQVKLYFELAAALQLVRPIQQAPGSFVAVPAAPAIERWLSSTSWEQHRRALHAWQHTIYHAPEIEAAQHQSGFQLKRSLAQSHFFSRAVMAAEWCALRRFVTRVLCGLPAAKWVNWPALAEELAARYPECAWTFTSAEQWWFELPRPAADSRPDWQHTTGAVVASIIRDALRWLGVVEAQVQPATSELIAFRLTNVGALLIQPFGNAEGQAVQQDRTQPASPPRWLDDFTLHIPPSHAHQQLIQLVQQAAERAEQHFTYRFTLASLGRARDVQPDLLDELRAALKASGVAEPPAVQARIQQVLRRSGRLRFYPSLTVVEVADEQVTRELLALELLQPHILVQLSPTTFLMTDQAAAELQKRLRQKGYHPHVQHTARSRSEDTP